jgi:deoxyribonuclease-1
MLSLVRGHTLVITWYLLISLLTSPPPLFAQNTTNNSFNDAKKRMAQVFAGYETTFYCGCVYTGNEVNIASCGYQPKKDPDRAKRLEWEHVVPAEAFGQSFKEWREDHPACVDSKGRSFKGRNCARKMATQFRYMEADLYNLQPAIGEMNGLRSNYSMEMIPEEKRAFGACDVEIENRKIEPRPEIRGDVARTYLYMDWAYPGHGIISRSNQKLFAAWNNEDPVDDWERERARRIEAIQGNRNPFILGEVPSTPSTAPDVSTSASGAIIGNKRTKIYHRPDCPGAAKVSQQNLVRFTTEAEAQAAGYRLAGNCS